MTIQDCAPLEQAFFDFPGRQNVPYQVVGMGSNAVDWILQIPEFPTQGSKIRVESMTRLGGGQVATASALCAHYGLRTCYIGHVGDDEAGCFARSDLAHFGLDLNYLETIDGGDSQIAFILVDPSGERTILWSRDPRLLYQPAQLQAEWIQTAEILHLDGYDHEASFQAAGWAREAGLKVSLDVERVHPQVGRLLELTDFLLPTLSFVQGYTGIDDPEEALLALDASTSGFLAATAGSRGCLAVWEGSVYVIPSLPVTPIDTTGAGDVFHGAFLYSLFQGWSVHQCLRFSNAAGALATTRIGSRSGIPDLEQVLEILGH